MYSCNFIMFAHGCTSTYVFNKMLITKYIYIYTVDSKYASILVIVPPSLK